MSVELRPCSFCGELTGSTVGGILTPEQEAENAAWARSLRSLGIHTGQCPHLVLPPRPACERCAPVADVMES